jgi:hypothetical protein
MKSRLGVLWTGAIVFAMAVGLASTAQADGVKVPNPVPYADDVQVRKEIRDECKLGEKIASYIEAYGDEIELVEGELGTSGRVLDVAISSVYAPAGGGRSGPKWMELLGTLKEDGKRVASFHAKRFSTGGVFGGFKGTCAIIGRSTKALGKDVAAWLKAPKDDADLGDARRQASPAKSAGGPPAEPSPPDVAK